MDEAVDRCGDDGLGAEHVVLAAEGTVSRNGDVHP